MLILGIFLIIASILIFVVYVVYNNEHERDVNIFDMLLAQVIFVLCFAGFQVLLDIRDRNDVHEIRCEHPAELKLGIDMIVDKDGNVKADTVYIYKFNKEIDHKHYPEK